MNPLLAKAIAEFPALGDTSKPYWSLREAEQIHTALAKLFEETVRECITQVKGPDFRDDCYCSVCLGKHPPLNRLLTLLEP